MRRHVVLAIVCVAVVVTLSASRTQVNAQESTPIAETGSEGVTFEVAAFGPVPAYPQEPAEIGLFRLRFAPSSRLVVPADDPGMAIHYVDVGTMAIRFSAPVVIIRGGAEDAEEAPDQERVSAGTEFTLEAGDSFVAPSPSGGEFRNDGTEEAVVLIAVVVPVPAATPTP